MGELDYSKLKGRIREKNETQNTLAKHLNLPNTTLSLKINCKSPFKQSEIRGICEFLAIPNEEIGVYFFTQKV